VHGELLVGEAAGDEADAPTAVPFPYPTDAEMAELLFHHIHFGIPKCTSAWWELSVWANLRQVLVVNSSCMVYYPTPYAG
jgi:hypothetical protein